MKGRKLNFTHVPYRFVARLEEVHSSDGTVWPEWLMRDHYIIPRELIHASTEALIKRRIDRRIPAGVSWMNNGRMMRWSIWIYYEEWQGHTDVVLRLNACAGWRHGSRHQRYVFIDERGDYALYARENAEQKLLADQIVGALARE